ncbi:carbohydrate-binding family 9-like protein [Paenibacillus hodogayensis]|uniref:Carbohydrate-binding family 9-like protein n=1 Tax=Paenibacillus hodogayensis TaxID=279208 RepID=A0ABV5W384_9BACL
MKQPEYRCATVSGPDISWAEIEPIKLGETIDGSAPRLETIVRMCRSADTLYIRFECEDDHVVANFVNRDDPIYQEDVVEIFIDEEGNGTDYKEYEFSPRNVVFDAQIRKEPGQSPQVDVSWDHAGLLSAVAKRDDGRFLYDISLPVAALAKAPDTGARWRINFYRIDDDRAGTRHFWAWSPTGRVNFHSPESFGTVIFE